MKSSCLILIAHGSKNPEWAQPFHQLLDDVSREVGTEKVFLCFMENGEPGLHEVAGRIAASGPHHCRLLPMLMAVGNHFRQDIPKQIAEITAEFPGLEFELLPPIGQHSAFLELMRSIIKAQLNA